MPVWTCVLLPSRATLRSLADDTINCLGEVVQVMCVQASHGDTAVLGLERLISAFTFQKTEMKG